MENIALIKQIAIEKGFDLVGCAALDEQSLLTASERYDSWLENGHAASMNYLSRHRDVKSNPKLFFQNAKSVLVLGILYATEKKSETISRYALVEDYHQLFETRLESLSKTLSEKFQISSKGFVDYSAVFERFWGWRAGLGWIGKNACLINRGSGSYFFLGGLFLNHELEPSAPDTDHCGRCRKCIDACPTQALNENREVESEKCIAYHTIENRGLIPHSIAEKTGTLIAGCDICQDVCPWNEPVTPGKFFEKTNPLHSMTLEKMAQVNSSDFEMITSEFAMKRMKYHGYLRNLTIAVANSSLSKDVKKMLFNNVEKKLRQVPQPELQNVVLETLAWAKNQ